MNRICKHCGKEIEAGGYYNRFPYLHKKCHYIKKVMREREQSKEIKEVKSVLSFETDGMFDVDKYAAIELFPPGFKESDKSYSIPVLKIKRRA